MLHWPDPWLPPINLWSVWKMEDSPCIGQCGIEGGVCRGCGRTIDEITDWSLMDAKERAAVNKRLAEEKKS